MHIDGKGNYVSFEGRMQDIDKRYAGCKNMYLLSSSNAATVMSFAFNPLSCKVLIIERIFSSSVAISSRPSFEGRMQDIDKRYAGCKNKPDIKPIVDELKAKGFE